MKKFRIATDIEFDSNTDPQKVKGIIEQYLLHGKDRSFRLKTISVETLDKDVAIDPNQLDLFSSGS